MPGLIKKGSRILFTGDSVTFGDRWVYPPVGTGYVSYIKEILDAKCPSFGLKIFNRGVCGDTAVDLSRRWHDDVLRIDPDILVIAIGINDAARTVEDAPKKNPPERYESLMDEMLGSLTGKKGQKIILVDPYFLYSGRPVSDNWPEKVLAILPRYHAVLGKLAKKYDAKRVRIHEAFMEQLKYADQNIFAPDRVHPLPAGQMVIAYQIARVLLGEKSL